MPKVEPWTTEQDELFRTMVEGEVSPEIIADTLDRSIQSLKARAYLIGLPLKWFVRKSTSA
jgi:hypothetical protein